MRTAPSSGPEPDGRVSMQEASAASSTVEVPEPDLTPREIVARAAAMRPELLERQQETGERTFYAQDTHEAFEQLGDRKSTRLNSSHPSISYAVFCLKKKK